MKSKILGIGLANPGNPIAQQSIGEFMQSAHGLDVTEARKLNFLYRKSGIDTRHSVLEDFEKSDPRDFSFFPKNKELHPFPGTKSRMEIFAKTAPALADAAVREALTDTGVQKEEITHLVLVSCTGMLAPGVELSLMRSLGLKDSVERYCIHFMGCYAAFTGLKLADKIVKADPTAKVMLVCVELCTLHFQKDYTEDNLLANSLFGDGAAAALVANGDGPGLSLQNYMSHVLWEGESDMAWGIGDFGFEMRLSKYIPSLLDEGITQLRQTFERLFSLSSIRNFAIHPGGKQIVEKVQQAFSISPEKNKHAFEVLRNFGNMSSATILYVLARMLQDPEVKGDILALGFGPGLTLEAMTLTKD
ncbi:type III polyketide synthase [Algoriphagus namhaensis]